MHLNVTFASGLPGQIQPATNSVMTAGAVEDEVSCASPKEPRPARRKRLDEAKREGRGRTVEAEHRIAAAGGTEDEAVSACSIFRVARRKDEGRNEVRRDDATHVMAAMMPTGTRKTMAMAMARKRPQIGSWSG